MADRYWVGGTGGWVVGDTTHWSATSGGAAGASVPTASDNVFFDANSNTGTGAFTVTIGNAVKPCLNLTIQGLDGVMTLAGVNGGIDIYGSLTLPASNFTWTNTGSFTLKSTTSSTITTNGASLSVPIIFNGVGGTWSLQDNFTTTVGVTLTNGTLNVNSKTISIGGYFTITAGTHAITNGTINCSTVDHTGGDLSIGTGYLITCTSFYFFSAGSITINDGVTLSVGMVSSGVASAIRSIAFGTGSITTTSTGPVWSVATDAVSLTYTGTPTVNISNNTATAVTVTNTGTSSNVFNFNFINGTYTLTLTTGNSYKDLNFTGFGGTVDFVDTTHTMYGNLTIPVSGGTFTGQTGINAITFARTSGTSIITTNSRTINFGIAVNGVGGTLQLADNFTQGSTQNLTLTNGTLDINSKTTSAGIFVVLTGTHAISNGTLTCASVTHTSGDLSIGTGYNVICTGTYTFTAGSITINDGVNLSVGVVSSANTGTRSIAFGTGSITTTSTGTVWNVTGVTGLTFTGTSNITISNNTATAVTVTNTATAANAMSFNFINGTYTLTLTTGNVYNNLNFTGFAGTVAFVATTHTMYGNLNLGSTATTSATAGTATLLWNSTSGTRTITSNGSTANFGISMNGVGQTLQLADALIQGSTQRFSYTNGTIDLATYSASFGILTITTGTHAIINGTLNCATVTHTSGDLTVGTGYTVVCSGTYTFTAGTITINNGVTLTAGRFSSSNINVRSIAFGTGNITVTGAGGTLWTTATATNLTVTGTPIVNVSNSGAVATTITPGSVIAPSFNFTTGTYVLTLTTSSVTDLNFTGFSGSFTPSSYTIYGNLTVSSTMTLVNPATSTITMAATSTGKTITCAGKSWGAAVNMVFNGVGGSWILQDALSIGSTLTLTSGILDLNSNTLTCGFFNGSGTLTRTIAYGTGNINVGTTGGTLYTTATTTNLTITGTPVVNVSYSGASAVTITSGVLGETSAASYNFTTGTYSLTFLNVASNTAKNINFTGFSGTWAATSTATIYGNLTLSNTTTLTTSSSAMTFASTATGKTITTAGKTIDFPVTFNGIGGSWALQGAMTIGSTRAVTLTNGTLNLNGQTLTLGTGLTTAAGTKNITFNGGTMVVPTNFSLAVPTGFTTTAGSAPGIISMTSASAKTFSGGDATYAATLRQAGLGNLTITGSNTFYDITNTVQPTSVLFTAGTTTTVSNFSLSGTAGNLITISSVTAAQHTLSKASGTVSLTNTSISYSNASGGATWNAFTSAGNTNNGNNTGWNFFTVTNVLGNMIAFF